MEWNERPACVTGNSFSLISFHFGYYYSTLPSTSSSCCRCCWASKWASSRQLWASPPAEVSPHENWIEVILFLVKLVSKNFHLSSAFCVEWWCYVWDDGEERWWQPMMNICGYCEWYVPLEWEYLQSVAVQCVLCSFLRFKWAAALLIDVGGLLVVRTTYTFC